MKINNVQQSIVNPYKANQMKAEQLEQKAKMKTDKLEISSEAKQLSEISSFTVERNERVQQLKEQVQAGNYEVDAEKLASSMLNFYKA